MQLLAQVFIRIRIRAEIQHTLQCNAQISAPPQCPLSGILVHIVNYQPLGQGCLTLSAFLSLGPCLVLESCRLTCRPPITFVPSSTPNIPGCLHAYSRDRVCVNGSWAWLVQLYLGFSLRPLRLQRTRVVQWLHDLAKARGIVQMCPEDLLASASGQPAQLHSTP